MNSNKNLLISIFSNEKPFPRRILINNIPYQLEKNFFGKTFKYYPSDGTNVKNGVVFLKIDDIPLDELPKKISINKRIFLQRMSGFYTPERNFLPDEISFYFDSIAKEYEKTITVSLNKKVIYHLISNILKNCPKAQKLRILDYGTGTGLSNDIISLPKFKGLIKLYGVDLSKNMIDICKRRGLKNVTQNSYSNIKFPNNYFDGIISSFTFHYFLDSLPLQLMAQSLKMYGILAFNLHRPDRNYYKYYSEILSKLGFTLLTSKTQSLTNMTVGKDNFIIPILVAKKTHLGNYFPFQLSLPFSATN